MTLLQAVPVSRVSVRTWLSIAVLAVGAFVLVATEFLPVGVLPLVADELNVSLGTAGLMILVPGLAAAVAAPLVVIGSNRLDRRWLMAGLLAVLVFSNVLVAAAPNFALVLLGRVLVGVALGGFWAVGPSLGFRLAGEEKGTRATSIILAGVSVGTVVALPIGQFVGDTLGWRSVFAAAAVLSGIALVALVLLLPAITPARALGGRDLLRVFRSPMARTGLLISVLLFSGQFAASTFITPFLDQQARLDPRLITMLFLAYGVAGIAGTLFGPILIARGPRATLMGTAVTTSLVFLLLVVLQHFELGVGVLVVGWGLLWGMIPLQLQTWMMAALPDAREAASAVLVSVLQLSIALGSLAGAFLVDSAGLSVNLLVAAAVVLVSAVVPLMVRATVRA